MVYLSNCFVVVVDYVKALGLSPMFSLIQVLSSVLSFSTILLQIFLHEESLNSSSNLDCFGQMFVDSIYIEILT